MRRTSSCCWARAANDQAAAEPMTAWMNSRRRTPEPPASCSQNIAECPAPPRPNSAVKTNKALAEIFAAIKFCDCARAILDPVDDILAISQASGPHPFGQPSDGFFVAVLVIEDKKTGHSRPLHEQVALDPRAGRRWVPARNRRGAANDHARTHRKFRQYRITDRSRRVVEIDIDAARTCLGQCIAECAGLVVNGLVVAELVAAKFAFDWPSGQ